mmetsp:Transcript_7242/g.20880  ORF Transcript_7242/g.20880 Transcript_7242/m.20880 type:complete len:205 (-) Transcript_7242:61-675(-)
MDTNACRKLANAVLSASSNAHILSMSWVTLTPSRRRVAALSRWPMPCGCWWKNRSFRSGSRVLIKRSLRASCAAVAAVRFFLAAMATSCRSWCSWKTGACWISNVRAPMRSATVPSWAILRIHCWSPSPRTISRSNLFESPSSSCWALPCSSRNRSSASWCFRIRTLSAGEESLSSTSYHAPEKVRSHSTPPSSLIAVEKPISL